MHELTSSTLYMQMALQSSHLNCILMAFWITANCALFYMFFFKVRSTLKDTEAFFQSCWHFYLVKYIKTTRLIHLNYGNYICLIVHSSQVYYVFHTPPIFQAVSNCIYWVPSVAHLPKKDICRESHWEISVESGRYLRESLCHHGRNLFP